MPAAGGQTDDDGLGVDQSQRQVSVRLIGRSCRGAAHEQAEPFEVGLGP